MTDLVAMLSTGKGTWSQVSALIKSENWGSITLVTNSFGKEKFTSDKPVNMIVLNDNMSEEEMRDIIINDLKDKLKLDVAVNFTSGSGKEHMALMAALVKLGVGIRLIIERNGIQEL